MKKKYKFTKLGDENEALKAEAKALRGDLGELLEYHCDAIDRLSRLGEERSDDEIALFRKLEALLQQGEDNG